MHVVVTGDADFKRFALACRKASGPSFEREMDRGLKEAGEDIAAAIHVGTDIYMPSGYEQLFRNRLLTKVEPDRPRRGVTVIAYARGKTGRRDVVRLERGELRHPVWGRTRTLKSGLKYKNPWSVTAIRPRFFSDPVKFAGPKAMQGRLSQAMNRVLNEIDQAT